MRRFFIAAVLVAVALLAFLPADVAATHPVAIAAMMLPSAHIKPLLHNITDVMAMLSCSRSTVYVLISKGVLEAVKVLAATKITDRSLQQLLSSAPRASIAGNAESPQPPPRKRASAAA